MEIIIFLVLGTILLLKLISEKAGAIDSQNRVNKCLDIYNKSIEFQRKYCDSILEREIIYRIRTMNTEELMREIAPVLLYAGETQEIVNDLYLFKEWYKKNFHYVLMIQMAKRGKIPLEAARSGIIPPVYEEDRPYASRLLSAIDDILIKNGVDEHMVLSNIVDLIDSSREDDSLIMTLDKIPHGNCRYYWWGMRGGLQTSSGFVPLVIPNIWKFRNRIIDERLKKEDES